MSRLVTLTWVFAGRQLRNNHIVILTVHTVEEPCLPVFDRPGYHKAWINFVELPGPALVLKGRQEIGRGKTIVIVTNAGLQTENSSRAFSILGRDAAALDLDIS